MLQQKEKNKESVDVILIADGTDSTLVLEPGDEIQIQRATETVTFAEVDKNAFLKALQEKFSFD